MGKNVIVAIVISIGLIVAYSLFFTPKPTYTPATSSSNRTASVTSSGQNTITNLSNQVPNNSINTSTELSPTKEVQKSEVSNVNIIIPDDDFVYDSYLPKSFSFNSTLKTYFTNEEKHKKLLLYYNLDNSNYNLKDGIEDIEKKDAYLLLKTAGYFDFSDEETFNETNIYQVRFSKLDGSIKSLRLKEYSEEDGSLIDAVFHPKSDIKPLGISFVNSENLKDRSRASFRLNDEKKSDKYHTYLYAIYRYKDDPEKKIRIEKNYTFYENSYYFDLEIVAKNISNASYEVKGFNGKNQDVSYYVYWGEGVGPVVYKESAYDPPIASYYTYSQKTKENVEVEEKNVEIKNFRWIGLESRYILASLIPDPNIENPASFGEIITHENLKKDHNEVASVAFNSFSLKPGETKSNKLYLYVGPKKRELLTSKCDKFPETFDPYLESVSERPFALISLLMICLEWLIFTINGFVNNFGLSIIIMTIIFKIILNPLTKKTLESSKRMQELQPKIKAINEQYKNKPEAKNKAIMEMYKKEKINPLSGCLPILIQLPFFWALYKVLPYILDLKHSNFLWIKDLSSPDTVANLNLFLTNDLNILPLIMTVTSFIQMKMTPQVVTTDQQKSQAKMMQFMPILFLFIFWNMPSGLVLYWTVQNMLQVGQQYYMNVRKPKAA